MKSELPWYDKLNKSSTANCAAPTLPWAHVWRLYLDEADAPETALAHSDACKRRKVGGSNA